MDIRVKGHSVDFSTGPGVETVGWVELRRVEIFGADGILHLSFDLVGGGHFHVPLTREFADLLVKGMGRSMSAMQVAKAKRDRKSAASAAERSAAADRTGAPESEDRTERPGVAAWPGFKRRRVP
jgi:hypothetical protein